MIDTIKIYTEINKQTNDTIENKSIVKQAINKNTGEILYNITNDSLAGSYDSRLSVRVGCGAKYSFAKEGYYIEIEGSYHKYKLGYNSHNGFYNLIDISKELIKEVEKAYNIILPPIENWFLYRVDIAHCFDLENQNNVCQYLSNLKKCTFPRRKIDTYKEGTIYFSGSTTTLKIYNKYKEFKKHDMKKFSKTDFDLQKYLKEIAGFVRFEVEIKKRKLLDYYNIEKSGENKIKIIQVKYEDLCNIWEGEFMKLLKCNDKENEILIDRNKIKLVLENSFNPVKARNLYNFYITAMVEGIDYMKEQYSSSTYYRYVKELSDLNISIGQTYNIEITNKIIDFNPFTYQKVS